MRQALIKLICSSSWPGWLCIRLRLLYKSSFRLLGHPCNNQSQLRVSTRRHRYNDWFLGSVLCYFRPVPLEFFSYSLQLSSEVFCFDICLKEILFKVWLATNLLVLFFHSGFWLLDFLLFFRVYYSSFIKNSSLLLRFSIQKAFKVLNELRIQKWLLILKEFRFFLHQVHPINPFACYFSLPVFISIVN